MENKARSIPQPSSTPIQKAKKTLINLNLPICRVSGKVMIFPWFSHDFPGIPSPWAPATQHEPPLPAKLPVAFALAAALAQLFQQPLHKSKLEQLETWTCQAGRAWDFSGSLGKMGISVIKCYKHIVMLFFLVTKWPCLNIKSCLNCFLNWLNVIHVGTSSLNPEMNTKGSCKDERRRKRGWKRNVKNTDTWSNHGSMSDKMS